MLVGGPKGRRPSPAATAFMYVAIGGFFGTAARDAIAQALPTAAHGWPWATFLVNLTGAFALGLLLEILLARPDRRLRLLLGTGFLGTFTTYSTFAIETDLLVRASHPLTALAYAAATLAAGLVLTAGGVAAGSILLRRSQ